MFTRGACLLHDLPSFQGSGVPEKKRPCSLKTRSARRGFNEGLRAESPEGLRV